MQTAIVNKIISFSSVDGPGNRTAIFLQGCGFACVYCHNPETIRKCLNCGACVNFCKTGALTYSDGKVVYAADKCVSCDECIHHCPNMSSPKTSVMTVDEVFSEAKKRMPFIRGITVSGGECTGQRDFLLELLKMARQNGLHTLLDSNGSYLFEKAPELMAVTDGVMLDIKAFSKEEHLKLTGSDNATVLRNLDFLLDVDKLAEVRTVIVPELINCGETVRFVAGKLKEKGKEGIRYKIIKYRVNGVREEFRNIVPPTEDYLKELAEIAKSYGLSDVIVT